MSKVMGDLSSLSEQLVNAIESFVDFIGVDFAEFKDKGNSEELILHKDGKKFTIKACGTKVDGGFFGYDCGKKEKPEWNNGY